MERLFTAVSSARLEFTRSTPDQSHRAASVQKAEHMKGEIVDFVRGIVVVTFSGVIVTRDGWEDFDTEHGRGIVRDGWEQ